MSVRNLFRFCGACHASVGAHCNSLENIYSSARSHNANANRQSIIIYWVDLMGPQCALGEFARHTYVRSHKFANYGKTKQNQQQPIEIHGGRTDDRMDLINLHGIDEKKITYFKSTETFFRFFICIRVSYVSRDVKRNAIIVSTRLASICGCVDAFENCCFASN